MFSDTTSFSNFNAFAPCDNGPALVLEKLKEVAPKFEKSEYPGFLFCILCTILITDFVSGC